MSQRPDYLFHMLLSFSKNAKKDYEEKTVKTFFSEILFKLIDTANLKELARKITNYISTIVFGEEVKKYTSEIDTETDKGKERETALLGESHCEQDKENIGDKHDDEYDKGEKKKHGGNGSAKWKGRMRNKHRKQPNKKQKTNEDVKKDEYMPFVEGIGISCMERGNDQEEIHGTDNRRIEIYKERERDMERDKDIKKEKKKELLNSYGTLELLILFLDSLFRNYWISDFTELNIAWIFHLIKLKEKDNYNLLSFLSNFFLHVENEKKGFCFRLFLLKQIEMTIKNNMSASSDLLFAYKQFHGLKELEGDDNLLNSGKQEVTGAYYSGAEKYKFGKTQKGKRTKYNSNFIQGYVPPSLKQFYENVISNFNLDIQNMCTLLSFAFEELKKSKELKRGTHEKKKQTEKTNWDERSGGMKLIEEEDRREEGVARLMEEIATTDVEKKLEVVKAVTKMEQVKEMKEEIEPAGVTEIIEEKKPTEITKMKEEKKPTEATKMKEEKKPTEITKMKEEKKPTEITKMKEEKKPTETTKMKEEKKPKQVKETKEEKGLKEVRETYEDKEQKEVKKSTEVRNIEHNVKQEEIWKQTHVGAETKETGEVYWINGNRKEDMHEMKYTKRRRRNAKKKKRERNAW